MPADVAHAPPAADRHGPASMNRPAASARAAAVRKRNHLALPAQIPYDGVSGTAGRREDMGHVIIPRDGGRLVELCTARSG
jgi:hypothetical protein